MIPTRLNSRCSDGLLAGFNPETFEFVVYAPVEQTSLIMFGLTSNIEWNIPTLSELRAISKNVINVFAFYGIKSDSIFVKDDTGSNTVGRKLKSFKVNRANLVKPPTRLLFVKRVKCVVLMREN